MKEFLKRLGFHFGKWKKINEQSGRLFDLSNHSNTIGRRKITTYTRECTNCGIQKEKVIQDDTFY
jgi:hypothetical protein